MKKISNAEATKYVNRLKYLSGHDKDEYQLQLKVLLFSPEKLENSIVQNYLKSINRWD